MIVGLTKTVDTSIIGQPQRRSDAKQKRVDSVIYSFNTNILISDMPRPAFYDLIVEWLIDSVRIPLDAVKDMEFPLDIPSGQLGIRFTLILGEGIKELTENAYAADIKWSIKLPSGQYSDFFDEYPTEYAGNAKYSINVNAAPLSLQEVEALLVQNYSNNSQ